MAEKTHRFKQIDKIKVHEDGVIIDWSETIMTEQYNDANELTSESKNKISHTHDANFMPHKDFMDSLKMLRKPVIDICEFGDYKNFDKYRIYGVSYSGEQDEAQVIISFGKQVEWSGKVFNSNTPLTPLYDQDKFEGSKLVDKFCKNINEEAWKYMEGKHADNPQLSLAFESGTDMNLNVQPN